MGNAGRPVLLLAGAAGGLGAHISSVFAEAGYDIVGLSRSDRPAVPLMQAVREAGGTYVHAVCDLTQPAEVAAALRPYVERIDVLVYNAAALVMKPFAETTPEEFEHAWRVASLGAFVTSQIVLPHMLARGSGALRGLAQALSREYGAQGIHVAHVVLDGLIDAAQTDQRFGPGSKRMDPDALARAYLYLATQHPSAWTHELDLRPAAERF